MWGNYFSDFYLKNIFYLALYSNAIIICNRCLVYFHNYFKKPKFCLNFWGKVGKLGKKKRNLLKMVLFLRPFTKYMKMKSGIISVYHGHYLGKDGAHLSNEYKGSLDIIISDH